MHILLQLFFTQRIRKREEKRRKQGSLLRQSKDFLIYVIPVYLLTLVGWMYIYVSFVGAFVIIIILTTPFLLGISWFFVPYFNKQIIFGEDYFVYRDALRRSSKIPYNSIIEYGIYHGVEKKNVAQMEEEEWSIAQEWSVILFIKADRFKYPLGKKYKIAGFIGQRELVEQLVLHDVQQEKTLK